jgi:signal transduction histidine kinase
VITNPVLWGVETTAQQLAQEVIRNVPVTMVSVAVWDQPSLSLTVKAVSASRSLPFPVMVGTRVHLAAAPCHRAVFERRAPVYLDEGLSETMSPEEMKLALTPGLRSVCLLPILFAGELVGIVALGEMRSRERAPITDDARRRCLGVVEEFLSTSNHSWEAARLRRQVRALSLLVQTVRHTLHAQTYRDVLAGLGARVADWLGVPVCGILLRSAPSGVMEVAATWDLTDSTIDAAQLVLSISRAETCGRGPVTLTKVIDDPLDPLHPAVLAGESWTRVCLPLLQDEQLLGVACLYLREDLYLATWELEVLRWLGEVAAAWVQATTSIQEERSENEWLRRAAWDLLTIRDRTGVEELLDGVERLLTKGLPERLRRLQGQFGGGGPGEAAWEEVVQAATREAAGLLADLRGATHTAERVGTWPLEVNALVRRVVEIARVAIEEQSRGGAVPLRLELDSAREPMIVHGSTALVGALAHAIANALEALPEGGQIVVRAHPDDGHVVISVADDGPGVPVEHLESAFTPLFSTKGESHLGLGLAVVRSVAARHGGVVKLSPRDDGGTVLELRFPKHDRALPRSPARAAAKAD